MDSYDGIPYRSTDNIKCDHYSADWKYICRHCLAVRLGWTVTGVNGKPDCSSELYSRELIHSREWIECADTNREELTSAYLKNRLSRYVLGVFKLKMNQEELNKLIKERNAYLKVTKRMYIASIVFGVIGFVLSLVSIMIISSI